MDNYTRTQSNVLRFVEYELRHMVHEARDAESVGTPMMDDTYVAQLTAEQRDELAVKLMDMAKWIRNL
jgi:hypothetical protein